MKKNVKILVFPDPNGNYPEITKQDVRKVIDLEEFSDGEHFSVARLTFLENKKNSSIEALRRTENVTTNLFLWNQPPQEELHRIINYPMPKNVKLFHVDHKIEIPPKEKVDLYFEKLELLSQKRRQI